MPKLVAPIIGTLAIFSAATCRAAASDVSPVAVWDGDFTELQQEGYTLSLNGNATNETGSVITIGQSVGVTVDFSAGMPGESGVTVLFKYSNLDLSLGSEQTMVTRAGAGDDNRTGVYLSSAGQANGVWNGGTLNSSNNGGSATTQATLTSDQASGIMAFTYGNPTEGTRLYRLAGGERTPLYIWGGLGAAGNATSGVAIGGNRGTPANGGPATGMEISAIAVFDRVLSEAEMLEYTQGVVEITDDTPSFSDIKAEIDNLATFKDRVLVYVQDGASVGVDAALPRTVGFCCSGSLTLSRTTQDPIVSYFDNVDFAGVEGAVKREWLGELGVVGVNFASDGGDSHSDELVASETWIATTGANGSSTEVFLDGLSKMTWSSSATWGYGQGSFLHGYLDDGANGGNGATVTIENMPYDSYDVVIYAATDNGSKFLAKTVNGKSYSAATGETAEGSGVWGVPGLATPAYNVNALRIRGLSGPLTISGGAISGSNRGGIAAIQIMPADTPDNTQTYTLTLDGTATNWSEGAWKVGETSVAAPTSGSAVINLNASTALTVDEAVALGDLTVNGSENAVLTVLTNGVGGSFVAYAKVSVAGGVLRQGSDSVLGATPNLHVCNGATFDLNGRAVNSATAVHLAGDGAGSWPWALTSSSGAGGAILGGLYLADDATIGGANELKVGQTQNGYYCYLQGFTLTKIGAGAFTGTNMNTPETGTIDVQGGAMSVNQWNNLNSSSGNTVLTLREGASFTQNSSTHAVAVHTLNLLGGVLNTPNPLYVKSRFVGDGETARLVFRDGASASLAGDLTVTTALTLDGDMAFNKDVSAAEDVVVTASGTFTASGAVSVGAGVTLNLGTNRPTATFDVDDDATLSVQLQSASDVVELSVRAQPASIVLYDANGDVVSNPRISYADGTLTIMPPVPTLEASGAVAFDTASNWINSTMPEANGDAIIELAADATVTVSGTYTLGALTITGSGEVTFAGDGSVTAANILLKNGATLTRNTKISATSDIAIDSGTVLKLDTVTENAVISGAGAVETYGSVKFAANNTFTGGLTVNLGSLARTTAQQGFGKNNYGQAIANLSRIVVRDGGSLDLANTKDACYAITIAGKGVYYNEVYLGALFNSGPEIGDNSRQTASLTLSADAMVRAEASTNGWGIVNSGHAASVLALNGHTLTVSGAGYFPIVNANTASGTTTTGTLVLDGVTLGFVGNADKRSDLTGVDIVAKGCARINLATAPTAIGSLTIKPSNTGTSASNWNLPSEFAPTVDTSNLDVSALSAGNTVTLLTVPSAITLVDASNVTVRASGRFETAVNEHTVTATLKAGMPSNFLHYDFDNVVTAASDSGTSFTVSGEDGSSEFAGAKNGRAVHVHTGYTPYWGSYENGTSPLHAGAVTVTTVAKLCETNIILWGIGSGSNGASTRTGLVVKDAHTVQVLCEAYPSPYLVAELATTEDLTKGWHFYAVVADADGVSLYVDRESVSSDRVFSSKIGQQGRLGSFHGGAIGASKVGADGYLLDDWRIYDTALTGAEIKGLKGELLPDAFFIRLR